MARKTREQWLEKLADELNKTLFKRTPLKALRVSCGFPTPMATARKNQAIGACWARSASAGKYIEIFISPVLADSMRVADVLAHEMIHGIVGLAAGHRGEFARLARQIGLAGKLTATTAGPVFIEAVQPIIDRLGAYPHDELLPPEKQKKQGTRMIKCVCSECGYTCRTTQKWLAIGAPICPIDNIAMMENC